MEFDPSEHEARRVTWFNGTEGSLSGYDCPACLNRGRMAELDEMGRLRIRPCRCMALREVRENMERCGISAGGLDGAVFETWKTPHVWQTKALELAQKYVETVRAGESFPWFLMGGTPGSGKTKLCTTVFRSLLESGIRGIYLSWSEFSREAKSAANDADRYQTLVGKSKKAKLLYLDDLWKGNPSPADVRLAFELLNDRYSAPDKATIISTEYTVETLLRGDNAVGSRIFERSKGFYIDCSQAKNWRLEDWS